jgi:hypothetical protein
MEAFMKKSTLFLTGMLAMALVFGLVLTGCPTGSDDSGAGSNSSDGGNSGTGEELPAVVGENELNGKTYVRGDIKIEFAADKTYKELQATWDEEWEYVLTPEGKYNYTTEIENGSYSWDATAKKVVLKPAKIAYNDTGVLQDPEDYRKALQKMLDDYKETQGQDALNQALAGEGFSSLSAYIDYAVDEAFANTTFAYVFAAEGAALLLSEELPASSGTNELNGKTLSGTKRNDNREYVKDTDQTYAFTGDAYTYTYGSGSYTGSDTGAYAWNTQRKWVYLKTVKDNGKTNVEYFNSLTGDDDRYNNATEFCAAQTNGNFTTVRRPYDLTPGVEVVGQLGDY